MTPAMADGSDARIVDLEVRYTYLERMVRELDQVVIELRGEVDRLRGQLIHVSRVAVEAASSPENEKPPHY
jgi:uncharacterized coiled-coil protein SlyX